MRLIIISDIHDNLINLGKALQFCQKENIFNMICCGDITNSKTLGILGNSFMRTIHLVRGNMEIYNEEEPKKYENIKYYGRIGRFCIGKITIGLCHEPYLINYVLKKGKCDVVFYGHTHKPWEEEKDGVRIINPGNAAGSMYKATFAVWDTANNKLELKILDELKTFEKLKN